MLVSHPKNFAEKKKLQFAQNCQRNVINELGSIYSTQLNHIKRHVKENEASFN